MELTVVVTRESGSFWSEVDELPGCFASGRTLSELRDALAEAIGMYLWDLPGGSGRVRAGGGGVHDRGRAAVAPARRSTAARRAMSSGANVGCSWG